MRLLFIFLFSFLINQLLSAQPVAELQKDLLEYSQANFQEKIFVHTDKSFYVPGEIIWFKVYVVDSRFHTPVDLSKVAYIEILDKNNTPVLQAKTALTKGSGNGSFLIPVSLSSGNFRLRAYTRWMRNYDPGFYFEKSLTIINTLKTFTRPAPEQVKYDIQFFPEGGNLVDGHESKVAFKINDQYGKGRSANGILINQQNDTLLKFASLHAGIGNFSFIPKSGETYKAIIKTGDSSVVVSLPSAYGEGYVLHLEDAGNQLRISVTASGKFTNETVYLFSHTRGKNNFAEAKQIKENGTVFSVDKSLLPPGITTFTLFNQSKQPVCERLYFKKPETGKIELNTDNRSYATRSKVTIDLLPGSDNDSTDFSLSVYHLDSLQSPDNTDIVSYLLLESDLKGTIESPEYYFSDSSEDVDIATDNLMLTHGWRRFKWEEVLSKKKPAFQFIPEYEGHIITGKIVNRKTGQPAEKIIGYLSSPARKFQFVTGSSNQQGLVYFNTKDFTGAEQIITQTNTWFDKDYRVDILSPFSELYNSKPQQGLKLDSSLLQQLLHHSINSQVQTTFINDSLNRFNYFFADSNLFYGIPDKSYYPDDFTRFTTMEEVLREYIIEAAPRKQDRKFHIYLLRNPQEFFKTDPLVLIDGVPFFDMDSVMAVDPLKIRKIDIIARQYMSGALSSAGILSYSTYKGDLDGIRLDPNAVLVEYEGLQLQREFYSPKYETTTQKNSRIPDFRNTLFWSPAIKLAGQKKQLSFYTSDLYGKYIVIVQGISSKGNIYTGNSFFEVKK